MNEIYIIVTNIRNVEGASTKTISPFYHTSFFSAVEEVTKTIDENFFQAEENMWIRANLSGVVIISIEKLTAFEN